MPPNFKTISIRTILILFRLLLSENNTKKQIQAYRKVNKLLSLFFMLTMESFIALNSMPTYFFFFLHKQSKSRSNLMNSRKRNSQVITATKDHKWAGLHLNSFLTDRKNIDGFIFKSNVFEEFVILKIHLKKINMFQVNSSL